MFRHVTVYKTLRCWKTMPSWWKTSNFLIQSLRFNNKWFVKWYFCWQLWVISQMLELPGSNMILQLNFTFPFTFLSSKLCCETNLRSNFIHFGLRFIYKQRVTAKLFTKHYQLQNSAFTMEDWQVTSWYASTTNDL